MRNFKTLRDIATEAFDARAFRYMVVTAQYRSPLNFTPETLKAARSALRRIDKLLVALRSLQGPGEGDAALRAQAAEAVQAFEAAMCDDMNTPRAAAALFSLLSAGEKALKQGKPVAADGEAVLAAIAKMDSVLGVVYEVPAAYFSSASASAASADDGCALPPAEVPAEVLALAEQRAALKADKRYAEADAVRLRILDLGYRIKDSKEGAAFFRL